VEGVVLFSYRKAAPVFFWHYFEMGHDCLVNIRLIVFMIIFVLVHVAKSVHPKWHIIEM
jgi:hypothetical protein